MAQRTLIIAEAGVNHNGSLDMAKRLIDVAVDAGADIVKFQTFKAEKAISRMAPKAEYQKETTDAAESQFDMVKKLELDADAHRVLLQYCQKRRIEFLSTPFDGDSVDLLARFGLQRMKIPSGELTNAPLILQIARKNKPVILSTGMCTLADIEQALGVLAYGFMETESQYPGVDQFRTAYCSEEGQLALRKKVTLLHCTTEYPAPYTDVHLLAMDTLQHAFGLPVGLSDHTEGILAAVAAVARGATVIEKHITLDKNLPGPDHRASLEPAELKQLVESIRTVEDMLGRPQKCPAISELKNQAIARKSLVASAPIRAGEVFTENNLTIKRPGTGVSPMQYWDFLGRKALESYQIDELIKP